MKENKNMALLVLIAATGINLLNGMLYTWSSISQSIIKEWGWTSKQASLPYSMHTIFFVIAMVIFGHVQDKKGPRGIATIGSILLGLGFILSGFTQSPIISIITIGVVVGTGIGMHTVTTGPTAIKWYSQDKKGLITGIVASGAGLSSLIYSPVGKSLLTNVGINKTFIYIGVGVLLLTTLLSQLLKNPTSNSFQTSLRNSVSSENDKDWRFMLKDLNFYKLWIMYSFSSAVGLMLISHIATIAKVQANLEIGYILIIIVSVFNSTGRILGGLISDKIGRINLLKLLIILQGINMALFNSYSGIVTLIIGVAIAGFCYGSGFSVFPATISDYYGQKNYGQNYGLMFTAWGVGGLVGPMTGAMMYDTFQSYNFAFILALAMMIVSAIISLTFKEKRIINI